MKKNTLVILILLLALFLRPVSVHSENKAAAGVQTNMVQQQMILLGLYMYGIDQERSKGYPSLAQLRFFGDSICELSKRLQTTKIAGVYHQDLQALLKNAQRLKNAKTMNDAKGDASTLMETCANCHSYRSKP